MDEEVNTNHRTLCHRKAKDISCLKRQRSGTIAKNLLKFETLTGDEIKNILSGRNQNKNKKKGKQIFSLIRV